LEDLYGRFDAVEFLAEQVPDDPAEALAMQKYYRWLGVADRPRV
jgi:hypothetical protein